jgi:hypothetical protein
MVLASGLDWERPLSILRAETAMGKRFKSFEEFWPEYVRHHQNKLTRQIHVAGTTLALACAAGGLLTRHKWLLLVAPVAGYGPAWVSHFAVEGNSPMSLRHPLWSLRADLLMWAKTLDGTMDAEVERLVSTGVSRAAHDSEIPTNMATDDTLH